MMPPPPRKSHPNPEIEAWLSFTERQTYLIARLADEELFRVKKPGLYDESIRALVQAMSNKFTAKFVNLVDSAFDAAVLGLKRVVEFWKQRRKPKPVDPALVPEKGGE